MMQFQGWVERAAGADGVPVFVGLNAPFDWSFINYYFHYLLKSNPFGFAALDIKALYMGGDRIELGRNAFKPDGRLASPQIGGKP